MLHNKFLLTASDLKSYKHKAKMLLACLLLVH